jgi:predicted LPLAT superfamily acyltransferase
MSAEKEWKGRTGGAKWMHRSLIWMMRNLPYRGIYLFACIFVIPFCMLFSHKGYIAIYHFFAIRRNENMALAFWHTYMNHCMFAGIILDRFYTYSGGKLNIEVENWELYHNLADKQDGFVILSAHIGNYEAAGYTFEAESKRFNALVYAGEAETVMENRRRMFENKNRHMIVIKKDMSHLFEMSNALANGEILSLPADRIFGSIRHYSIDFMGREAKFPAGPFAIAAQRDVAVLAINVMKIGAKKYLIHIKRLQQTGDNIKKRAESLASQYAGNLENVVNRYPTQWFNYFEFWN